jgi:hypothetical protein
MTRRRVHGLSYEQCDVPADCVGVLASLFVERSAGGLSLEGLIEKISRRLSGNAAAVFRLEQTVADTLGAELPQALRFSFDFDTASTSLAWFNLAEIPAIRDDLPPGVSQVRFSSDVSGATQLEASAIASRCPAFEPFASARDVPA